MPRSEQPSVETSLALLAADVERAQADIAELEGNHAAIMVELAAINTSCAVTAAELQRLSRSLSQPPPPRKWTPDAKSAGMVTALVASLEVIKALVSHILQ